MDYDSDAIKVSLDICERMKRIGSYKLKTNHKETRKFLLISLWGVGQKETKQETRTSNLTFRFRT